MSAPERRRPVSEQMAGGLQHAIALRFLFHYCDARERAEQHGEDLTWLPSGPSREDLVKRYEKLVTDWVEETVESATGIRALVDFAATIMIETAFDELFQECSPVGREKDIYDATRALFTVSAWVNQKDIEAAIARERKAAGCGEPDGGAV